jgi:hypothetical protein
MESIKPKFDHLNPTEFEEFCYDLICEMTFKNVEWRKGTPKNASPADKGRDIQAEIHREDIDGRIIVEKWYFDCKHYASGIPPNALQDSLTWALANRPHKLVFVASGFFSNPSKEYLETYKEQNRPPFEIKTWEKKDLEKFCSGLKGLLVKHKVADISDAKELIHPVHWDITKSALSVDLKSLFQVMDSVDEELRDKAFEMTYYNIISPRYRKPDRPDQKLGELKIDQVNYKEFKKSIHLHFSTRTNLFMAGAILRDALSYTFHMGNIADLETIKNRHKRIIESISSDSSIDEVKKLRLLELPKRQIETAHEQVVKYQEIYIWLCEKVVRQVINISDLEMFAAAKRAKDEYEKIFQE